MLRRHLIVTTLMLCLTVSAHAADDTGAYVSSLWLAQRYGTRDSVATKNDQKLKAKLAKTLAKDGSLSSRLTDGILSDTTFQKLAGADSVLEANEVKQILESEVPASRNRLNPKTLAYADALTTSFDMIDSSHYESIEQMVEWIGKNYRPGEPLHVTVVCTGNSRRSILGATLGNVAAAYYGMPEIRFHSGGTAPTAFNPRTIHALKEVGIEIEPTGDEAPRGEPNTANPGYRVRWGSSGTPALETVEFSKTYFDQVNPQSGFAAIMVCSEADEGCPLVKGASARVSMPFLDPKIYDGSSFESSKYAERRDDLGRTMMTIMMQVRNRLNNR